MTGTQTKTPTTVASAVPDRRPNKLVAAATASAKRLLVRVGADGAATLCPTPKGNFSQWARPELK